MSMNFLAVRSPLRRPAAVLALGLLLLTGTTLPAGQPYLPPGLPDGIALLPPPPAPGSAEQAADLESAREVFAGRTPELQARAFRDASLSFSIFTPIIGSALETHELPKTEALMEKVKAEIGGIIDAPKDYFRRKRPYQVEPALTLGNSEPSYSYPSGHSVRGTVYSMILAEIFPEKREQLLAFGRAIGWDRVLIGKHFPTDVYAGRVLGKAIVRELMSSRRFRHDLAKARKEAYAYRAPGAAPEPAMTW